MELVRGDIVRSVAGHDRGSLLLVTDVRGDRICVVDGRLRKLDLFGKVLCRVTAKASGVILYQTASLGIEKGTSLVAYGKL